MHDSSSSAASFVEHPSSIPAPAPRRRSESRALLDAIDSPAALLDEAGVVREVNQAWSDAASPAALPGQPYLGRLRSMLPTQGEGVDALAQVLNNPPKQDGVVTERTFECHNADGEHWFTVSISTARTGARRAWLVLHQDATALRQLERRHRLTQRLAAVQVVPQDPALRVRRLAVVISEVLHATVAVVWERALSGVLRARPLETSRLAPQVATIAHTRQLLAVMDGRTPQWIRLLDGAPCYAVPLRAREQVVLFHFAHRPRFDAETLRLVVRALQPDAPLQAESPRPARVRSTREVRRQIRRDPDPSSPSLMRQERVHIERTLALCGNNIVRTARALGIARSTLYERLRDYGIAVPPRAR